MAYGWCVYVVSDKNLGGRDLCVFADSATDSLHAGNKFDIFERVKTIRGEFIIPAIIREERELQE